MEAIILAGGLGTRLRGVVSDVPKPMAPVSGKPFLVHILNQLAAQDFQKVVLAVGYKHEVIEQYFGNEYQGMEILYSLEDEPLGTGGCIKKALQLIDEEDCYIINGDTYFDIDFSKLDTGSKISIACKYMEHFSRYGEVVINQGKIQQFNEKKEVEKGFINGGIYFFKKNVFDGFDLPTKFSLEKDFFEKYIQQLDIGAYCSQDYFIDIGIPEDYFRADEDFKKKKALFLDRDGVINYDYGHVHKIEDFVLIPGIIDFCRRFQKRGFLLFVVSNQAGIAKGLYSQKDLDILDKYMKDLFKKEGVQINASYYCPHFSEDCSCRKPKPGLILKAKEEYDLSLERSILIGDKMSDLLAGYNAGIENLIFKKGNYKEEKVDFHYASIQYYD